MWKQNPQAPLRFFFFFSFHIPFPTHLFPSILGASSAKNLGHKFDSPPGTTLGIVQQPGLDSQGLERWEEFVVSRFAFTLSSFLIWYPVWVGFKGWMKSRSHCPGSSLMRSSWHQPSPPRRDGPQGSVLILDLGFLLSLCVQGELVGLSWALGGGCIKDCWSGGQGEQLELPWNSQHQFLSSQGFLVALQLRALRLWHCLSRAFPISSRTSWRFL